MKYTEVQSQQMAFTQSSSLSNNPKIPTYYLIFAGWFYDKRTQQKLEFIDVRKGENVKIQLSLQVRSSLPEQKI